MKLFISDLDGTLLNNDGILSPYSLDTLNKLIDQDINFTIATGRDLFSAKDILKELKLKLPIIIDNGAIATNSTFTEIIKYFPLDLDDLQSILNITQKNNCYPNFSYVNQDDYHYVLHPKNQFLFDWLTKKYSATKNELDIYSHINDIIDFEITSVNLLLTRNQIDYLERDGVLKSLMKTSYSFYQHNYFQNLYWLHLNNIEATKGLMIKNIFQPQFGEITSFGDNINDISMFEISSSKIAPNNGEERIKNLADIMIDSNSKDSVANFIKNEFNNGKSN